jgi:DtxR family transcriptional regulator, Mn-dependent transcriptional regulator
MDIVLTKSDREMLKAAYRLTKGGSDAHTGALAEHLGLVPGTVTAAVKRLAERDLVTHRPYKGVELTSTGRMAAIAAIRRHRIVERFLADVLGYAWQEADRLAGSFEHELPQEVEDRIYEVLGRPATCPHGFPIPGPETDRIPQMPSLDELQVGDVGVVALSGSTDREILTFLDSVGIRPGASVEIIEKHPFDGPIVVAVDGQHRTVGERLAKNIFVKARHLVAAEHPGRAETEPVDARTPSPSDRKRKETPMTEVLEVDAPQVLRAAGRSAEAQHVGKETPMTEVLEVDAPQVLRAAGRSAEAQHVGKETA